MKRNESRIFREAFAFALVLAFVSMFSACSDDKVAGGSSDDAGVYAVKDLDVAGVSQKGPFVKGSAVTVQGIDCQTMELTGEIFEGTVKSDKGDYDVSSINLSSPCAVFEVSGYYLNEVTGAKSADVVTLQAITNLKDRKNVNVNVLTSLEYGRVKVLATEMSFAEAKKQAEKEVLMSFGVAGAMEANLKFEDLNIFEKGNENATLLAVGVLLQGDGDLGVLAKRLEKFVDDIAQDGEWNDSQTKTEIAEWAIAAASSGKLDSIRKNIESWGYTDEVPTFEMFVDALMASSSSTTHGSSSSSNGGEGSGNSLYEAPCKTDGVDTCEYSELMDERDAQIYKTVKIGNQVWMAENLNYKTENSYCYNDSTTYCDMYGRLYTWDVAMGICPSGWHLPDSTDWKILVETVGGWNEAGKILKSKTGWISFENGDNYGFSLLPGGFRHGGGTFNLKGYTAYLWVASENPDTTSYARSIVAEYAAIDSFSDALKDNAYSVRCIKDSK